RSWPTSYRDNGFPLSGKRAVGIISAARSSFLNGPCPFVGKQQNCTQQTDGQQPSDWGDKEMAEVHQHERHYRIRTALHLHPKLPLQSADHCRDNTTPYEKDAKQADSDREKVWVFGA